MKAWFSEKAMPMPFDFAEKTILHECCRELKDAIGNGHLKVGFYYEQDHNNSAWIYPATQGFYDKPIFKFCPYCGEEIVAKIHRVPPKWAGEE